MSRVTRSRSRAETPQTVVTDFFKITRKPRTRGEKKIIEENEPSTSEVLTKEETRDVDTIPIAPIFEKKTSRTRARTPARQVELSTPEVTGTPPKKAKEIPAEVPSLPAESQDVILDNPNTEKSALDELMEAAVPTKKKTAPRTVADLQSRLAAKGAARAIHAQNLKNKAKLVDEHAAMLKSPKKKMIESPSSTKSKAARALISPKKSVPDYVVPGFNVMKSAEKVREEQDDAHEEEGKRMTTEYLKTSMLVKEVKESVLELPSSYAHLADSFKRVDQYIGQIDQKRTCLASELFKNVKFTPGKKFSKAHLSQILHVYPESYHVEMREKPKYELEVRPNLADDLRGYIVERAPVPDTRKPEVDGRIRLDAARQRDRTRIFRHKLSCIVLEHHKEFLESQGLPTMDTIQRLHPLFRLEKHCPVLPKAKLPEPPVQKSFVKVGMKEALDKHFEEASLPSSIQRIISDLKSPQKVTTGTSGAVPLSPKKFMEMQVEPKSKGSMTLLERIRAKEAIKKAADALIDKDLEKRKHRLILLKERYVRIVCNHYIAKNARTLEMETVAKFVQFSSSIPSTIPVIIEHLKLMCEVAPMYVTEVDFKGEKLLRFTDNNFQAMNELVDEELHKTQQKIDAQRKYQIAQMCHAPRPKAARCLKLA